MLSITHIATASVIARTIPNPLLSLPLILASHYLLDAIPHWDCGAGIDDGSKSKKTAIFQELLELGLSAVFLMIITQSSLTNIQDVHIWIAAFVSLIPDFLEAPANFLNYNPKLLKIFNNFHSRFHASTKDMRMGLTPQLVFLFLVYLFG